MLRCKLSKLLFYYIPGVLNNQIVLSLVTCFNIFSLPLEHVMKDTSEAEKMLRTWNDTYFEVRASIEASGRDARWEFDRKKLFEKTNYMADICHDLNEIATVDIN